ncbi:hypothetical protein D5041_15270 [Verminephrobacter aporrectodeae subsp. tuberculatae]|uniref:preATP grasp domain-containing protein n=1 Tax=Verminephrobacter aporrectodeae TaxID=1110389 RepID=UPI0022375F4C|nr:peptide ligase PGM1-related protein [Verminephrobacter aporrectodeae]MCW5221061.1 hypothetical protein [Verminephrobacter aporrectodeae subsp. tuberculatae]MCW5290354.1 hypothetical protein [Verminephrobacter aporrectodeae subsp. tuberculatae]
MSKLFFANFVNELMTTVPGPGHARNLTAGAIRKIWLAEPGDLLVLPRPMDPEFFEYACDVLRLEPRLVEIVSPSGGVLEYLAQRLRQDEVAMRHMRAWVREHPGSEAVLFAQDRPSIALFAELGLGIQGYADPHRNELVDLIYHMNTKDGFRNVARDLGIPIPAGARCQSIEALVDHAQRLAEETGRVIVKFNRGSNGYGNHTLERDQLQGRDAAERVAAFIRTNWAEQPTDFVVETYYEHSICPSVELRVEASGPQELYACDQRSVNNAWRGTVTPPQSMDAATRQSLSTYGARFGAHVWAAGYRGICDVDFLLTSAGKLLATETNFRRTGGTYLETLVRRLTKNFPEERVWLADNGITAGVADFRQALLALHDSGLQYDAERGTGCILTANTLPTDRRLRYLVIGKDFDSVCAWETELRSRFALEA